MKTYQLALLTGLASSLAFSQGLSDKELDDLMAPTDAPKAVSKKSKATVNSSGEIVIKMPDEPILRALFVAMAQEPQTDFFVKEWFNKILYKDYVGAAHVWNAISDRMQTSLQSLATHSHLFTLWKLNIPATFLSEWSKTLQTNSSRVAPELLLTTLAPEIQRWMWTHDLILDELAEKNLRGVLGDDYWIRKDARNEQTAPRVLSQAKYPATIRLTALMTISERLGAQGRAGEALTLINKNVELINDAVKTPAARDQLALGRARLHYQNGDMRNAIKHWSEIPRTSLWYPTAIEERSWALAIVGNFERVRGEIESLTNPIYQNYFGPEVFVLKAITELKLCQFANVRKTLGDFASKYYPVSQKIETTLAKTAGIDETPVFVENTEVTKNAVAEISKELVRLEKLRIDSAKAPLSAVGRQAHWADSIKTAQSLQELARHRLDEQRLKTWRGMKTLLVEATKKLQFVKVELMSQLSVPDMALKDASELPVKRVAKNTSAAAQVYEFDGVVFPDELFRLRSLENSLCKSKGI